MKLVEELVKIRSVSSDESAMKEFVLQYVQTNQSNWSVQPQIISGDGFQDCVILVFGKPTTVFFLLPFSFGSSSSASI